MINDLENQIDAALDRAFLEWMEALDRAEKESNDQNSKTQNTPMPVGCILRTEQHAATASMQREP